MLLDCEVPSMLIMTKRSNVGDLNCIHAPVRSLAVLAPAPSTKNRFLVNGGTCAVSLWGTTKPSGGLMVRGAVRVITDWCWAAAQLRESLERGWVMEMGVAVEVMGKSAGVRASQATSTPSVAQVLLQEFLQLILVLLTVRLSGKAEAQVQPSTDSQRATLFLNLTLTLQAFLFLQLPLCIFL